MAFQDLAKNTPDVSNDANVKPHYNLIVMNGLKFGRLTVLSRASGSNTVRWNCVCECGGTCVVAGSRLRGGQTKSCGCLVKELRSKERGPLHPSFKYGIRSTPAEYAAWNCARHRTTNPADGQYKNYGGRGIRMCERWLTDFGAFLQDMGRRPDGMTLERIDNEKGYSPDNCKWATPKEQARNRRGSIFLQARGETKNLAEWSAISGVPYGVIHKRINDLGWEVERAIFEPVVAYAGPAKYRIGEHSRTVAEWSKVSGVSELIIRSRLKRQWTPERAIFQPTRKSPQPKKTEKA